ncbi:MAG TPA: CHAD domain-containing protein [Candidatus Binataceae bacterium]|nr:CHAD domain-containing protein [Candidatus Binataceae bacterium]
MPVKRYPVIVVDENLNSPVTEKDPAAPAMEGNARVDDRARLQRLLSKQLRNCTVLFARTLAEEDADVVHDLRVCTRRLQQILFTLAPQKDLNKARSVRRTLRRVRRALGEWRNCDVALQWVRRAERRSSKPERKNGWKLVRERISTEREQAIQSARRKLYKAGGITLNHRIQQLLALPPDRLGTMDPPGVVRGAIASAAAQWHAALGRAKEDRSVRNIHALRIQTKRLRYRVELARDLGSAEAPTLIKWFKLLQDRLGHWHDRQELNHFIARALADCDVLVAEPRVAVELLREIEKDNRISSREVEELLRLATESEGARFLDSWVESYCSISVDAAGADPLAPDQPIADPASEQPQSTQSDGEVRN